MGQGETRFRVHSGAKVAATQQHIRGDTDALSKVSLAGNQGGSSLQIHPITAAQTLARLASPALPLRCRCRCEVYPAPILLLALSTSPPRPPKRSRRQAALATTHHLSFLPPRAIQTNAVKRSQDAKV